ncbi:MAG: DUF4386 domain-containing protein [Flavobacteriales bacterium]|nr:DUF4386 domain-containing protein [Flavobacteriales bacterium]MCB9449354.1 DUF4386 domain-containing protein [Flavobacteriales bacterium]
MKSTMNQKQLSRLTGIALVVMAVAAAMSMGMVFAPVFEMTPDQFAQHLPRLKMPLFFGILGWVVILMCDLFVSWGLYELYAVKDEGKSKAMGLFRLIYSLILMMGIVQLIRAVALPSGDADTTYDLIQSFQSIWQFGLIVFGVHLLLLAGLVCEKKTILQIIGMLLFVAGIGYVVSNMADLFIADYESIRSRVEAVFVLPMILGELGLAVWLLVRGGREVSFPKKQCVSGSC